MPTDINPRSGVDGHQNIHVDQGSLPGEHPGRARNPVIKGHCQVVEIA